MNPLRKWQQYKMDKNISRPHWLAAPSLCFVFYLTTCVLLTDQKGVIYF